MPNTKNCAVVPLKTTSVMKSRLANKLGDKTGALAIHMATDVLAAISASPAIDEIYIVSADQEHRKLAEKFQAIFLLEEAESGLGNAVTKGFDAAKKNGADLAMFLPGDIPLLSTQEVNDFIWSVSRRRHETKKSCMGLLASVRRGGTNAIILDPSSPIQLSFGEGSYDRHRDAASKRNIEVVELWSDRASLDIDEFCDLTSFMDKSNELGIIEGSLRTVDWVKSTVASELSDGGLTEEDYGDVESVCHSLSRGERISEKQIYDLSRLAPLSKLKATAKKLSMAHHGNAITYSPKVFIPLTRLCRNVCHYCTFATSPSRLAAPYLSEEDVMEYAQKGLAAGCKEALFTLGELPESRYSTACTYLEKNGFASTVDYLIHIANRVRIETGLLPHINAGNLTPCELEKVRDVAPSIGLMLENVSPRLCEKGNVHYGSPDKNPARILETIEEAGRQKIPVTTGILIGIGETRREIIESVLAIRRMHEKYGHIQEVIIQNFVPKLGTKLSDAARTPIADLLWALSVARIILGGKMNIQVPPNLNRGEFRELLDSGMNDWGGVSSVTPDFVNPESPWPDIQELTVATANAGFTLQPRLTVYPFYVADMHKWISPNVRKEVLRFADAEGLAREDDWMAGVSVKTPNWTTKGPTHNEYINSGGPLTELSRVRQVLEKLERDGSEPLSANDVATLFSARGPEFHEVCARADRQRRAGSGDTITYVVNRNINYTNMCTYKCGFCAFSKGAKGTQNADKPYLKSINEVVLLAEEAWERGATEVCLQGGIHPKFTGRDYIEICNAVRQALPSMHIHAFSPLEVLHGASTLDMSVFDYLSALKDVGLNTLPGTAAEILDDGVRNVICPDKLSTDQWVDVIETAHQVGLKTTSTIMFGHVDNYSNWATHLLKIREIAKRTGGITEFVPLAFVSNEAPIYLKGKARSGPTFREAVLMHAVARLVLQPFIQNIQTSWVKMGLEGANFCLKSGANDLGGTLMNESITRAAGASHGQELHTDVFHEVAESIGRSASQRNTQYSPLNFVKQVDHELF